MSAILSADDLNDFISPGVACIKPIETIPVQAEPTNPYEVTTEDQVVQEHKPASISLTDCLACSGCVTSAEAVLVSLQSHAEVLQSLDSGPPLLGNNGEKLHIDGKVFVASVSPQVRASLAATYGLKEKEAGWMIEQLLSGPAGLASGGKHGNRFAWTVDTNNLRDLALVMGAEEVETILSSTKGVTNSNSPGARKPILTSACPGWVCYAEKTHPHILPHLSRLKSPQALAGTMLKSVLAKQLGIHPDQIWHLAVMPCFDKKLEASRQELTDKEWWMPNDATDTSTGPVRDVDCVITAREVLMLAESRNISFPALPREPVSSLYQLAFPDKTLQSFLFDIRRGGQFNGKAAGSSGGYLYHVLKTQQHLHPGSELRVERGRNSDVADYMIVQNGQIIFRAARYYGFRNIQNLVRKLKPARRVRLPGGKTSASRRPGVGASSHEMDYTYVEVMACPGGCTNGGGQIKVDDLGELQGLKKGIESQRDWLARVDEAYYSMESDEESCGPGDTMEANSESRVDVDNVVNCINLRSTKAALEHWSRLVVVDAARLIYTSYREVQDNFSKNKVGDTERVAELAGRIGGGW